MKQKYVNFKNDQLIKCSCFLSIMNLNSLRWCKKQITPSYPAYLPSWVTWFAKTFTRKLSIRMLDNNYWGWWIFRHVKARASRKVYPLFKFETSCILFDNNPVLLNLTSSDNIDNVIILHRRQSFKIRRKCYITTYYLKNCNPITQV